MLIYLTTCDLLVIGAFSTLVAAYFVAFIVVR